MDARQLGENLRIRTISRLGGDARVGIGPATTIAATAYSQVPLPGGVLAIAPEDVTGWFGPLPVDACTASARAKRPCSGTIHCVGLFAALPPATIQRLVGGKAGRLAADRARGIHPRSVVPRALCPPPRACDLLRRTHPHGAVVRAAQLQLVVRLGTRLRDRHQAASALTLTLKYAGGGS